MKLGRINSNTLNIPNFPIYSPISLFTFHLSPFTSPFGLPPNFGVSPLGGLIFEKKILLSHSERYAQQTENNDNIYEEIICYFYDAMLGDSNHGTVGKGYG